MHGNKFFKISSAILFCLLLPPPLSGQSRRQTPGNNVLPRVGIIKDLSETGQGAIDQCSSHFIQPTKELGKEEYIFISTALINSSANFDVLMNLDGRDVRLVPLETVLRYNAKVRRAFARHEYRFGKTRVTVSFEVQPDAIYPHPAKIVLRNGSAARTIRAFVAERCSGGE